MNDVHPDESKGCTLCGRDLTDSPPTDANDNAFCSTGCRTVHVTLGSRTNDRETDDARRVQGEPDQGERREGPDGSNDALTRAFLRVDGMQSATCESFLESRAEGCEGVAQAEASYVTETIRIDYDPDHISRSALCETLSTVGYTAIPREEAPIDLNAATRQGNRQLDSALGYRYAVGVLFGSFLMLTYVALVYPVHLSSLLGDGVLPQFAGTTGLGGNAVLILPLYLVLTGVVLFFTGLPLLRGAYVGLRMRQPNTEVLASITVVAAYLYSTVAVLRGRIDVYFDLTIVIAAAVVAAIFYESLSKQQAMDRLTELTISQIDEARRYLPDGTTTTVPVEELEPGDRILVRQGERIPVDGKLASGECTVDEAVVTGESLPVVKSEGDEVIGGSIVTEDAAVVAVSDRETSTIDRLISTVWRLQTSDHGVHRQANRLAARIAPALLFLAFAVGGTLLILGADPTEALLGTLTVLLVASPWALGLAIPLSVATSVTEAVERGIVIFDETILERLQEIDVAVFDKTGTLTTGQMSVIDADAPTELLVAAAALERRASHPAASAIADAFSQEDRDSDGASPAETDTADGAGPSVQKFESHSKGAGGVVDGTDVLIGHPDLFHAEGWSVRDDVLERVQDTRGFGRIPVLVGREGQAEGFLVVGDEPRTRWDETVTRLAERGIDIIVLTGDDEDAAEYFGDHSHVDHVFAGVSPAGKTATVRRLQADQYVTMVGDGTNDAPALSQADLGISLGSGTALASDAADIAIVDDDLTTVETAFDLARAARRRLMQNTALAFTYNLVAIPLAAVGLLNPLLAMVAVVVSAGLLVMNSFRELVAT